MKMNPCDNCPAFMRGQVHKQELGFEVRMFDHCLFWKWVSKSAVMPNFPPEECVTGEVLKKVLYDPYYIYELAAVPISPRREDYDER